MFDNPNKELQRLQDQLLAAEKKRPAKKPAPRKAPAKRPASKPKKEAAPEPQNKTYTNSLWIALMLELLALAGVLIWWLLWN